MSNHYPVGSSMSARINFDESVRNYAHSTYAVLDEGGREYAHEHWEEYYDPDAIETDDPEEARARFQAVWQWVMGD